ncbi:SCO family protein [Aquisalimonas lutea]|uniref:SCO family protein n=1 Tax=Aquisalimonas lutea TaxID=1327750 RepID=UPI0025B555B3|nr:SCO family protein [Aquisalimonas lutea]MDN3517742.1 SCO family protein [Aquisalimonas lutea]
MKTSRIPVTIAGILVATGLLLGGVWAAGSLFTPSTLDGGQLNATYLQDGRAVTDFQLVNHRGEPFTGEDLEGRWTLMFFGFTHCPDICPTTLGKLSRVHALLEEDGLGANLQTVFVTVDPARDTPARLESYVTSFRDDFIGVTGPLSEIDVLAADLGISHQRHDDGDGDDYAVDHGTAILLINPEGRFQALFSSPHRPPEMSRDLARILEFHGAS